MLLSVKDLTVARGGLPVLTDLSFDLGKGEAIILRGPNGIGKTTLLRTLAGLQPALDGVLEGGEDRIAYAGHADGLKPTLSVVENLEFWADIFGTDGVGAAIKAFDLEALQSRRAGELSAGQKRRLGLARLLVVGRPVWLLDEPTVSLDTRAVEMFASAVQTHLDQGGAAVIATHIDIGLTATVLDVTPHKADIALLDSFDEAFL